MDANHQPIYFREEDHLTSNGDLITYQDHHTGHRSPGKRATSPARPRQAHRGPAERAAPGVRGALLL
ncbi:hypothetical protein NKH77_23515 [Streptomyces sp. M19]